MRMAKDGKGRKVYGRRIRGPGAPPTKHKRRVKWETPKVRCQCHHAWPCPHKVGGGS
jgi:hypothetical protein